MLGYIITGQVR